MIDLHGRRPWCRCRRPPSALADIHANSATCPRAPPPPTSRRQRVLCWRENRNHAVLLVGRRRRRRPAQLTPTTPLLRGPSSLLSRATDRSDGAEPRRAVLRAAPCHRLAAAAVTAAISNPSGGAKVSASGTTESRIVISGVPPVSPRRRVPPCNGGARAARAQRGAHMMRADAR